eukprot:scaffold27880_cov13-Tisochrysis_lutea.AAC.1
MLSWTIGSSWAEASLRACPQVFMGMPIIPPISSPESPNLAESLSQRTCRPSRNADRAICP